MPANPAIHVRYPGGMNFTYAYSVERLADGLVFDFAGKAFLDPKAFSAPATTARATAPLAEQAWPFQGSFWADLPTRAVTPAGGTTAAQFPDGSYLVRVHMPGEHNQVVDMLLHYLKNGDDQPTA